MSESEPACRLCESPIYDFDPAPPIPGICVECTRKLGLMPMPPPRRRAAPCQRCNGMTFVRTIPREYTAYAVKNGYVRRAMPMTATQVPAITDKLIFPGKIVNEPQDGDGRGVLENYICKGCGFVEWYCQDPTAIPIGPEYMTDEIDYSGGSGGPFR